MTKVNQIFNKYLTWIVLGVALTAFTFDQAFVWASNYTTLFLQIIMFFMGLTLSVDDFKEVFRRPAYVTLVSLMQFLWMPFARLGVDENLQPAAGIGLGRHPVGLLPRRHGFKRDDLPFQRRCGAISDSDFDFDDAGSDHHAAEHFALCR